MILILIFGVKAAVAVGTDLVYSVPMKALAAFAHIRQGTVDGGVVIFAGQHVGVGRNAPVA